MSTTSDVTPYDTSTSYASTTTGDGVAAGAAVAAGVMEWLLTETPEEQAAVAALQDERRRELVEPRRYEAQFGTCRRQSTTLRSFDLHLRKPESLVRAAEELGYRLEPLSRGDALISKQRELLLVGSAGERLAITRNARGKLRVSTAGPEERIPHLVRHHTVSQLVKVQKSRGVSVNVKPLRDGRVVVKEENRGRPGSAAVPSVAATVRADGTVVVDVSGAVGNACEPIVSELAAAVGGEVVRSERKEEYFRVPAAAAPERVRV